MFRPMPRLRDPSAEEFGWFVRRGRPVVIEGALSGWPALSTWTFERLGAAASHVKVRVQSRLSEAANDFEYREITFGQLVDSLHRGAGRDYMVSWPLLDDVPELAKDIEIPRYAPRGGSSPRLFVGPKGGLSPLHYDLGHSLSAQLRGKKRVIVADFRLRHLVKHRELIKPGWTYDRIDPEAPSSEGLGVVPARRWECMAMPGDLVFLPARRHHFLRLLEDSISMSFFWHDLPTRLLRRVLGAFGRRVPV